MIELHCDKCGEKNEMLHAVKITVGIVKSYGLAISYLSPNESESVHLCNKCFEGLLKDYNFEVEK